MVEYYHTLDEEIGKCALKVVEDINKISACPFVIHGGCATQIYVILHCQEDEREKYLRTSSDLNLVSSFYINNSTFRKLFESVKSKNNYNSYTLKDTITRKFYSITRKFYSIQLSDGEGNVFQINIPKLSERTYNKRIDDILRIYNDSRDVRVFSNKVRVESPETNVYNKLQRCYKILKNKLEYNLQIILNQVRRNPYSVKEELYQLRARAIAEIESLGYSKLFSKIRVLEDLHDIATLCTIGVIDENTLLNILGEVLRSHKKTHF